MTESTEDQHSLVNHSYYVQSPSTDTRTTHDADSTFHSPARPETTLDLRKNELDVSRYTYSRESKNNFSNDDHSSLTNSAVDGGTKWKRVNRLVIVDGIGNDHDQEEWFDYYGTKNKGSCLRCFSFQRSDSCAWMCLQMGWRLVVSLVIALLVFYVVTKPPHPNISIKVGGVHEFVLGEGVDGHGVTTKILTFNSSIDLLIDNNSKLFGLHIHSSTIHISFYHLLFATSHVPKLYAESDGRRKFEVEIGTRNKAMYGAGREMQDLLDSIKGLPLVLRLDFASNYRVLWNLIKPTFHHKAECSLVIHRAYDKRRKSQVYTSFCKVYS